MNSCNQKQKQNQNNSCNKRVGRVLDGNIVFLFVFFVAWHFNVVPGSHALSCDVSVADHNTHKKMV